MQTNLYPKAWNRLFVSNVTSVATRTKSEPSGNHLDWGCIRICRLALKRKGPGSECIAAGASVLPYLPFPNILFRHLPAPFQCFLDIHFFGHDNCVRNLQDQIVEAFPYSLKLVALHPAQRIGSVQQSVEAASHPSAPPVPLPAGKKARRRDGRQFCRRPPIATGRECPARAHAVRCRGFPA